MHRMPSFPGGFWVAVRLQLGDLDLRNFVPESRLLNAVLIVTGQFGVYTITPTCHSHLLLDPLAMGCCVRVYDIVGSFERF